MVSALTYIFVMALGIAIILIGAFLLGYLVLIAIPACFIVASRIAKIKRQNPSFTTMDALHCYGGFTRCICVGPWGHPSRNCLFCFGRGWIK